MEHWSNINATYGRLSSASGIPTNASGLSPFDLHVMDQRSFASAGLGGGLANPLPAHAAPLPPARLTSMTHPVNYGSFHGSMNPLFEGFNPSGFSNQSSYRPTMGQAALYSLEAVSGSHADTMSRLASVISSQPARSSSSSSSALFNTDPHTMNDSSSIQGLSSASDAAVAAADFWSRSGFMSTAAGVGPFLGMQPSSTGSAKKDPPPAHSGSRPTLVASSKSRCYHETPLIAQQSKPDYAMSQTSRATMASSPPTAHANSQRFEAQRFFPGRSSQAMTPAVTAEQRYIDSSLQMDLNDVMSSDDTSGSVIGQGPSFGGCSPTTFPSTGFPVSGKPRTMFQPQAELAATDSRGQATSYGALVASTNPMLTSYNEYGMSKGYPAGAMAAARVLGPTGGVLCGRNPDREDSFGLGGLLGCSSATQASVASILTVQAVADSTTKPKKSAGRSSRMPKAARSGRASQGFDGGFPGDDDMMMEGLGASDGRRGRTSKARKSSEGRDQFGTGGKEMMDGGSTERGAVFESTDRYMPQLMAAPGGSVSALGSAVFNHGISTDVHLSSALLHGSDVYPYGPSKPTQETQVFLTNLCGNSFINPNELLLKENADENFPGIQEQASYADGTGDYEPAMKQRINTPPPQVIDEEFTHLTQDPVMDNERGKNTTPVKPTKQEVGTPSTKGNFLDSFVNFLSGKKPETLSSVSSAAVANRPILPKYIPDIRPRRTEEDVKKASESAGKEKKLTPPDLKSVPKPTPGVVVGVKILDSVVAVKSTEQVKKSAAVPAPMVPAPVVPARERPNAIPVRPQPMRKAKTVVEEQRKRRINSDDSSDEEMKTVSVARNRREVRSNDSDYDSDKDPAWKPAQSHRKRPHQPDEELESPGKRNRSRKLSAKSESIREVVSWASPVVEPMSIKAGSLPETATLAASPALPAGKSPRSSGEHSYQKGDFVIEKKDIKNATYSIWKIDTGRLLQKYEPVVKDGRHVHQAISTYSSWSDDIKVNYVAIRVNVVVASRVQEVVEVIEDFRPKDPNSAESFVEPFSVFIQILLSQSLEPNFLDALLHDPEPYYMDPLGTIETAIESRLDRIKAACKWTKEFVEDADNMSKVEISNGTFDSLKCQATEDASIAAVASVKFFGKVYIRSSMKTVKEVAETEAKELLVGALTLQHLPVYHALRHLKLTLFELCQKKVLELRQDSEMEDHQVLDACLQNPIWLKELFKMLEGLFNEASSPVVD